MPHAGTEPRNVLEITVSRLRHFCQPPAHEPGQGSPTVSQSHHTDRPVLTLRSPFHIRALPGFPITPVPPVSSVPPCSSRAGACPQLCCTIIACIWGFFPREVAGSGWGSAESRIREVGAQQGLQVVKNKKYNKKSTRSLGRHRGMYRSVLLILLTLAEASGFSPLLKCPRKQCLQSLLPLGNTQHKKKQVCVRTVNEKNKSELDFSLLWKQSLCRGLPGPAGIRAVLGPRCREAGVWGVG